MARESDNAAVRLFCLPYAGGSAMAYARWRRLLPSWIAAELVEFPGRGARMDEPLGTDPHDLAWQLADEIGDRLDRPYALFGHSLGAVVAYELAHVLVARGAAPPLVLFASGTEAPSVRDDSDWRRPRSDAELIAELRAMRGTPEEAIASAELMETFLPILRADFLMCGAFAYRPRPKLPCPIHTLGGTEDDGAVAALEAWGRETEAGFRLDLVRGSHFFIHERQAEVLGLIEKDLAERLPKAALAATA